jgi:hypothetical protein
VHGTLTATQLRQAVGHRVAGYRCGLLRRVGQGQPGGEAGCQRRGVGAAGTMGRGDGETGDRDGQVP